MPGSNGTIDPCGSSTRIRVREVEPGDLAMGEGSLLFKAALLVFVAFLVLFVFRVV